MRNTLFALLAALTLSAGSGCGLYHGWHHKACDNCCDEGCSYCGPNCGACGPGGCKNGACAAGNCGAGGCGAGGCGAACAGGRCPCSPVPDCYTDRQAVASQLGGPPGPPSGQVTYPYYTTRGPR